VDTRNELDTVAYQVQRTLDERPPRTAPDRCGVSLPARLRQGSGEHCYVVIFPRAARSLLILGWGTHRGISERATGWEGSGMSAGVGVSPPVVVCSNCQTKNRVPAVAHGVPRCGKCHTPLRWVVNGSDASFADIVEAATIPVLVDMWAPWCGPCRMVSPVLEQLAGEFAGRLKLVKINADEAPELSQRFEVLAIPTLILLEGGKVIDTQVGAAPVAVLRKWVTEKLGL
jgi:thioredoxin 2